MHPKWTCLDARSPWGARGRSNVYARVDVFQVRYSIMQSDFENRNRSGRHAACRVGRVSWRWKSTRYRRSPQCKIQRLLASPCSEGGSRSSPARPTSKDAVEAAVTSPMTDFVEGRRPPAGDFAMGSPKNCRIARSTQGGRNLIATGSPKNTNTPR